MKLITCESLFADLPLPSPAKSRFGLIGALIGDTTRSAAASTVPALLFMSIQLDADGRFEVLTVGRTGSEASSAIQFPGGSDGSSGLETLPFGSSISAYIGLCSCVDGCLTCRLRVGDNIEIIEVRVNFVVFPSVPTASVCLAILNLHLMKSCINQSPIISVETEINWHAKSKIGKSRVGLSRLTTLCIGCATFPIAISILYPPLVVLDFPCTATVVPPAPKKEQPMSHTPNMSPANPPIAPPIAAPCDCDTGDGADDDVEPTVAFPDDPVVVGDNTDEEAITELETARARDVGFPSTNILEEMIFVIVL